MVKQRIGKVHQISGSLLITLPRDFVKQHNIKKGDEVGLLCDHWLQVVPFKRIDKKAKGRRL